MARLLVILGILFVAAGLVWPWLSRMGFGHLPGDVHIQRKGFDFYFPVTSSIIVSAVLSILVWLFRK